METKVDFLGNVLEVGDQVVLMVKNYRELQKGTIKKMTDKMAIVVLDNPKGYTFDSDNNLVERKGFRQKYDQLVKIQQK